MGCLVGALVVVCVSLVRKAQHLQICTRYPSRSQEAWMKLMREITAKLTEDHIPSQGEAGDGTLTLTLTLNPLHTIQSIHTTVQSGGWSVGAPCLKAGSRLDWKSRGWVAEVQTKQFSPKGPTVVASTQRGIFQRFSACSSRTANSLIMRCFARPKSPDTRRHNIFQQSISRQINHGVAFFTIISRSPYTVSSRKSQLPHKVTNRTRM